MKRGDGKAFPEPPTDTLAFDAPELRCFPPGQNQPAGPAIIAMVRRLAHDLPPERPSGKIDVESILGPGLPRNRPTFESKASASSGS